LTKSPVARNFFAKKETVMPDDKALKARSPNYPAISLATALDHITKIFKKIQTHPAPQDVILSAMGYKSYNGASAPAFSGLIKYGLLDKVSKDYKLSERAISIEVPRNTSEKERAIKDALRSPALFAKLLDQFCGQLPDDSLVRANLIREGFGATAVPQIIQALRESVELAARYGGAYDPHETQRQEDAAVFAESQAEPAAPEPANVSAVQRTEAVKATEYAEGERELLHGPLSRSASYRLVIKGDAGPKEIGKLIKILELQKSLLEDDEDEVAH
jgi:hypothetical protein